MVKVEKINLDNLIVNTENYRFEPQLNENEAINLMIKSQGEKLFNLAEDIITHGLNPNDKIQVSKSSIKNKYIVLEGNRRIVVLKLLKNPNLIVDPDFSFLRTKFMKLNKNNFNKIPSVIECTVYDDLEQAKHWIAVKHGYGSSGVGTESWDTYQKNRFKEETEGKTSVSLQIIKLLKSSEFVSNEIKENLDKITISNLDRLISDPSVREFIGIDIKDGLLKLKLQEKEVIKGLNQVVSDILDTDFSVSKIYHKEDREKYINDFPSSSKPDKTKIISDEEQKFIKVSEEPKSSVKRISPNRKKLIPKTCKLKIINSKVNRIYHELMKLNVENYTNAVSVLFRVFVELSLDCYIEKFIPSSTPSKLKKQLSLEEKVTRVTGDLITKKVIEKSDAKRIRIDVKNENSLLGIPTWHAYVHNEKFSPQPLELILTWDGIEDLITKLWSTIK
ncbi:MAG: hypothetical protein PHT91_00425 [Candidatus Nanoarchaeia archaeon]|nr:hypothetical protein [Candidatus Nanoarchaeia archaeon]MDD5499324.1 hypothetical protein [Candidatus Nanoarchaeia archaeon]